LHPAITDCSCIVAGTIAIAGVSLLSKWVPVPTELILSSRSGIYTNKKSTIIA
jgi:hypothetical protein